MVSMGLGPDPARGATARNVIGWRSAGVLTRLVVLVLVPLIALSLVSADLAVRMDGNATSARAISHDAEQVATRLSALEDVVVEHSTAMASYETELSGFSVAQAAGVLGVNIDDLLRADWTTTDRAVARVSPRLRSTVERELASIRTAVRRGNLSGNGYTEGYGRIESALGTAAASALRSLRVAAMSAPSTAASSLLALEACDDLVEASAKEVRAESLVWFTPGADTREWAVRLGDAMALLVAAGTRLAQAGIPAAAKAWDAYAASPSVASFNRLLKDGAYGMPMPFSDGHIDAATGTVPFSTLIAAYHSIAGHARLITEAVDVATDSARRQMAVVASRSSLEYKLWLIALAAACVVFLSGAVFLALSISRPLRRLEEAACSVVAGELGGEPLPTSGPTEMATVATAFNSLMANLRLLEAKAQALASCDFDNEALSLPLPGLLGASLQDSVRLLAGSIQDREQLQQRLAHEATHDSLTGLLNRAAAISQLQQTLDRAARRIDTTAAFYVDLDNFKQINDVHGHQAGDHVLREVGARLHAASRRGEIVARLGGDEFLVVAERVESMEEAQLVGERLLRSLSEPISWNSVRLSSGATIGLALCRGDESSASELLSQADLALYEAKRAGGNRVGVFDQGLQERLAVRDEVERELRRDLEAGGGGLVLYFQPVVDTQMQLIEVEALLRWNRPGIGLVGPDQFIPIAERTDLIIEIDNWVIATAVRQLEEWSADPTLGRLRVSVNVSGRHVVDKSLPGYVEQLLSASGVDPGRLTIEVTETVLLDDLTLAAGQLAALQRLGVQIAIDDFGTGYTSLAHLQHLPVDSLKIDRTFVSELGDSSDTSLIRMIIDLARHLGLLTVSEGVETTEQLDLLTQLGTDRVQGFLLARPMPREALAAWAQERVGESAGSPARALG